MYDNYKAFARRNKMETITCQVQGEENYRMTSTAFQQNLYANVRQELKPGISPVDLFHEDIGANIKTFPLLSQV